MRTATLGRTTVPVTALGFGAAPIGNLYRAVPDVDAYDAVRAAWAAGVRYFDTAPHYGLGLSERRLGAVLAGLPRAEFVVSTKVGRLLAEYEPGGDDLDDGFDVLATHRRVWDFSADGVRRSLESSLDRLGLDRVDVVLLHDPDDHWAEAAGKGFPALAELRDQGVVGAIGVGMNQWQMPARFIRETEIDVVMLAGRYSLLEQPAAAEFLPLCLERKVSVLAAGVFNSGLLSRHEIPVGAKYNYADAPPELVDRARAIAAVCERHGVTLPQAAIQFAFGHPAIASVVIGARTGAQMSQNADLVANPVPPALWAELRERDLLAADVSGPGEDG
ncbi:MULTISPECIES: aldo/keto reductase [unclassified Crossiella]|uniref:aldo/keto reductase n=1 Tax=unclassified Crossiella TaxID=2620835 RepID=UPI001FFECB7F|nr:MULTISPECIES: aldo/keto reductase [unclassified Crossiella]MCK2237880.1 aldo/keto reductase [Crossiella sp. S99.2]MCK2255166.1 aldo/keto reductase [Crossiella sp. S99.1]